MKNGSSALNTEKKIFFECFVHHSSNGQYLDLSSLTTKNEYSVREVGDFLIILEDERMCQELFS